MGLGAGPEALEAAVLRIRDPAGRPVGVGFLITAELAVTCAHVIGTALGLRDGEEPPADAVAELDLPLTGLPGNGSTVTATVEHWLPEEPSGAGDLAVLRLRAPLPGARPVRMVDAGDVWQHPMRAFGFPDGRDHGVWHAGRLRARQAAGWLQTEPAEPDGYPISRGFSGSPVWDDELSAVVGMVALAETRGPRAGYLISTRGLVSALPVLRDFVLPESPFRGLSAFRESDADVFHGRAAESAELAALVREKPLVTLVGPSGCGKSSLALAGVVPVLRSAGWAVCVLRPTRSHRLLSALAAEFTALLRPELAGAQRLREIRELTDELAAHGLAGAVADVLRHTGARRLLLVVDQAEELMAEEEGDDGTSVLFDDGASVLFAKDPPEELRLLLTLRADFLAAALDHPVLGPAVSQEVHALCTMSAGQLRDVVTAPLEGIPALDYAPGLVDRILADAGDAPGTLPLLGFALAGLWEHPSGGLLTHQAYEELGGVSGALANQAEEAWQECVAASEEEAMRRLFTQLVRVPTTSAGAVTRREVSRGELGGTEWRIARRLAAGRLLVLGRGTEGQETAELAHEALISGWPRLAGWVEADREFLAWRESLRLDLARWEASGRDPELLPGTKALAVADSWSQKRGGDLGAAERGFLEQGRERLRHQDRRRHFVRTLVAGVLAFATVLGALFLYQRQVSDEKAAQSQSRSLAGISADSVDQDPGMSILLAMSAYRTAPTREARNELLRRYGEYRSAHTVLSGTMGKVQAVTASPDGRATLVVSELGRVTLFLRESDGRIRRVRLPARRSAVEPVMSRDAGRVGYLANDGSLVWHEVRTGEHGTVGPAHVLPKGPIPNRSVLLDERERLASMSDDGRFVASASRGRIVWWDLAKGSLGGRIPPAKGETFVDVWFGPDDDTLVARARIEDDDELYNHNRLVTVDRRSGRSEELAARAADTSVSADGSTVAYCRVRKGIDAEIRTVRTADRKQLGRITAESTCGNVALDRTGRRVVHDSTQGLKLVDMRRGTVLSETQAPPWWANGDGRIVERSGALLIVGWRDAAAYYAELARRGRVPVDMATLTGNGRKLIEIVRNGTRIVLRSAAGSGRVIAERARPAGAHVPRTDERLTIGRDGALVADRVGEHKIVLRDTSSLKVVSTINPAKPPADALGRVADVRHFFDMSGKGFVTVSGTRLESWDARTGKKTSDVDLLDAGLVHSRDRDVEGNWDFTVTRHARPGRVFVVRPEDPRIHVLDLRTGREAEEERLTVGKGALGAFSDPDGRYLALLRRGSVPEMWSLESRQKVLGPLPAVGEDGGGGFAVGFLERSDRFLVADGGKVRIYRAGSRAYVESFDFSDNTYDFLDFSEDGKTLLLDATADRVVRLDPAVWRSELCRVIGQRELSAEERASVPAPVPDGRDCHG
ncbi:trypsin-like peptidase domain-containing protein [Streptomyces sp. NPDC001922]|uniref:nSTAND1 domain-containing NTPase n=1 Tax=Streptomyces sp. NPDC001922 TaxID=3364624 RepID=UPI0036AEF3DF